MADGSCDAVNSHLSSLCHLAGRLSVCLGVAISDSAQLCNVIHTFLLLLL